MSTQSSSASPSSDSTATTAAAAASLDATELTASLTVKDLEQSLAWYTGALGFEVAQRHERGGKLLGTSLRAGAIRILLNQDDGARGVDRVKGEGFSLMITTSQRVDDVADRIKATGGTLDSEPAEMPWGVRAFRVRDPDGYRLAISSAKQVDAK